MTIYYKAKDKMNCIQILYSSQQIRFSQGYGLAILRLLYIHSKTEQINKFIIMRVRSYWRKDLQMGKGGES